jgi:hypothetical protein
MDRVQHRHRAELKQRIVGAIEHGHVLRQEAAQRVDERDGNAEMAGRIRSIQVETDERDGVLLQRGRTKDDPAP